MLSATREHTWIDTCGTDLGCIQQLLDAQLSSLGAASLAASGSAVVFTTLPTTMSPRPDAESPRRRFESAQVFRRLFELYGRPPVLRQWYSDFAEECRDHAAIMQIAELLHGDANPMHFQLSHRGGRGQRRAAELLLNWLDEDSDYDDRVWPELNRGLSESQIRFGSSGGGS